MLKEVSKKLKKYFFVNRLFISYILIFLFETLLFRFITLKTFFLWTPFMVDLGLITLFGSMAYLFEPKKQFKYLMIILCFWTFVIIANSIYYSFYQSYATFSLIATAGQLTEVTDSIFEKLRLIDFIYAIFPFFFYYLDKKLKKSNYYSYVQKIENGKKSFLLTITVSCFFLLTATFSISKSDYGTLWKQWNRGYIVKKFGIILYQGNDFFQSLSLKVNGLFGYDMALQRFNEYFKENKVQHQNNKWTNILKGKNVIFIHMESIQSFVMPLEFNGEFVSPSINKLAREGMLFSKFYPQISTGTSSDTEFTLSTSLLPVSLGTVFVSYYNRVYNSIPKALKEQGYYTFSMHGNKGDMWNRDKMHPSLGYDKFFSQTYYNVTPENTIGLGLSDEAFFAQSLPMLEDIEKNNKNYYGTMITLSNHSPFKELKKYGEFDLTYKVVRLNEETGKKEEVLDEYLNNLKIGSYLKSVHYADKALGEFFDNIKESDYFNDTVFILYGDHDAKLSKDDFNFLYNYDLQAGVMKAPEDPSYINFDEYQYDINKNTPLIIWSKNKEVAKQLNGKVDYVMGMIDILPTLGNMMGFDNPYALGHDIFSIKNDNIVSFPNGNFLTNSIYYNNDNSKYIPLREGTVIDENYIAYCQKYTDSRIEVSNDIIIYNLLKDNGEQR